MLNEGFQLHRPELLISVAHGDSNEIKRLLLLHKKEDATRQVILDVEETVKEPAATASEALIGAGDSVLHVVASSGDGDEFLECATVIVGKANHLLSARNGKGDTPLHCATRLRSARMVSHLLALARDGDGTSDDRDGAGDDRVKAILRMQNDKGETVLHEAIRLEDVEMISVLLSADGASPLYLALSLGHRDIAQQLFEKDKELSYSGPDAQNALHAAIRWKWGQEATKRLLKRNKDLIKQADRSTGRTPLHYAALFGETSMTELLLSVDPSAAYLPDRNGSFPIHLAASNGQPHNVLALLQKKKGDSSKEQESAPQLRGHGKVGRWLSRLAKSDSSKEQNISPYSAQLRDGMGRTFLHVAVEKKRLAVVKYACQEQGKTLASSVMNMQDDQGNTALHLAVDVGDIRIVHALVSIPEVKLNLKNKKGQTPRELASIRHKQQGTHRHSRYSTPRSRIYWLLDDAANLTAPREDILSREIYRLLDDAANLTAPREDILSREIYRLLHDAANLTAPREDILSREIYRLLHDAANLTAPRKDILSREIYRLLHDAANLTAPWEDILSREIYRLLHDAANLTAPREDILSREIYRLLHDAANLTAPREDILSREIYRLLHDAANLTAPREVILPTDAAHLTASPRENTLPRDEAYRSQSIIRRTQIIGLGSAMLTAVTFAAAFAVPGGYRADGTPALAGQYAFDAFVVANTLAFISSGLSTIFLMFAGLGAELGRRTFSLVNSVNLLACSARSLGAAFVFGMYAVLAPVVVEATRFWTCSVTVGALVLVEADWAFRAVKMVYKDKVVLVKRFGISLAWLRLAGPVLVTLMSELAPYILLSLLVGYRRVE